MTRTGLLETSFRWALVVAAWVVSAGLNAGLSQSPGAVPESAGESASQIRESSSRIDDPAAPGARVTTQEFDVSHGAFPVPESGYVTDLADLLTDEEEERIERWLWQTESRSGVEIAVLTLDSFRGFAGAPKEFEAFATGLFNAWGIGNLPDNDGVLLLVCWQDRLARIELGGGYARARDDDADRIMQEMIVPRFAVGEYNAGIADGVESIMLEFANVRIGVPKYVVFLGIAALVGIPAVISLVRSGRQGWAWIVGAAIVAMLIVLFRWLDDVLSHMPDSDSDSWGAGGFGGGFGGGSSGGGGSTGSW